MGQVISITGKIQERDARRDVEEMAREAEKELRAAIGTMPAKLIFSLPEDLKAMVYYIIDDNFRKKYGL